MQTAVQDRLRARDGPRATRSSSDQFFLLYQPTFDLQSRDVTGVEALMRWRTPDARRHRARRVHPARRGDRADRRRSAAGCCRRPAARRPPGSARDAQLGIAVNVSARQLDSDELIDDVRTALQDNAASTLPRSTLEITETALMRDADATAARLRALKALGVRIAIDDFGTGYSSLAYLRQFPVDALKIDRSFIAGMAASEQSTALIHTLVALGKTLGLETLAEGIEDQAQLNALQREQCDYGQGFLFSRPLEVEAIEAFMDGAGAASLAHPAS